MRCAWIPLIALTAVVACPGIHAADAPTSQPAVRATTIDGKTIQGKWRGVDAKGALTFQDKAGADVSVDAAQAMSVRFAEVASSQPANGGGYTFYLADGSCFGGKLTSGGTKQLEVSTPAGTALSVPLTSLAAIRFAPAVSGEAGPVFATALADRDASQDVLVTLHQGRVTPIKGVAEQITPEGGSFRWRERSVPIRREAAYGIVFARGVGASPRVPAICYLTNGAIWGGQVVGGDARAIRFKTALGPELTLPIGAIAQVRFRSERVQFISELQAAQYTFEPFAVTQWPYRINHSVTNGPLKVGGQTFESGIAMHSQSRLAYELPGAFTQLAATIGIDDAVRPRGNVIFRVLADGKEVFASGPVSGADPPRPILVALQAPRRLELCVDFGDALDIADHADWGQIRLIK